MHKAALVIGDLALDRRTEGTVQNVSREGPVPVLRGTEFSESLGWAGNTAANIRALGHNVFLVGTVGGGTIADHNGQIIGRICGELGIQACLLAVDQTTTVKHRLTCNGQLIGRFDTVSGKMSADTAIISTLQQFPQPESLGVIVICDNGNGTITEQVMTAIRTFAARYRLPIFVDCRPDSVNLYKGVTLLKPNFPDAMEMLVNNVHPGLAAGDPYTMMTTATQQLQHDYNVQLVVVTNGRYGCAHSELMMPDQRGYATVRHVSVFGPAAVDRVKDVCGAGDTTMAALAVGCLENMEFSAAVTFAMQAAGYVVQFYGVKLADRDGVNEFIYQHGGWSSKLMVLPDVLKFVVRKRNMGNNRIVLTNGCFDGFHAGHLETLRFAKRYGEVLIVAYNDDDSLRQLKGAGRPHVPDSYRSSHLAMQEPVDAVVRFDGDVERLVRLIKPDVLVKGADSRSAYPQLPGANFVASYGGRVEFCPVDQFYITIDRNQVVYSGEKNAEI